MFDGPTKDVAGVTESDVSDNANSRIYAKEYSSTSNKTTRPSITDDREKTQHVRSYTRKDGTVVKAYDRKPSRR
jgi:hypothetical protein